MSYNSEAGARLSEKAHMYLTPFFIRKVILIFFV